MTVSLEPEPRASVQYQILEPTLRSYSSKAPCLEKHKHILVLEELSCIASSKATVLSTSFLRDYHEVRDGCYLGSGRWRDRVRCSLGAIERPRCHQIRVYYLDDGGRPVEVAAYAAQAACGEMPQERLVAGRKGGAYVEFLRGREASVVSHVAAGSCWNASSPGGLART